MQQEFLAQSIHHKDLGVHIAMFGVAPFQYLAMMPPWRALLAAAAAVGSLLHIPSRARAKMASMLPSRSLSIFTPAARNILVWHGGNVKRGLTVFDIQDEQRLVEVTCLHASDVIL